MRVRGAYHPDNGLDVLLTEPLPQVLIPHAPLVAGGIAGYADPRPV
jgi:hypothetical protein